jgi:hypothetical protein
MIWGGLKLEIVSFATVGFPTVVVDCTGFDLSLSSKISSIFQIAPLAKIKKLSCK